MQNKTERVILQEKAEVKYLQWPVTTIGGHHPSRTALHTCTLTYMSLSYVLMFAGILAKLSDFPFYRLQIHMSLPLSSPDPPGLQLGQRLSGRPHVCRGANHRDGHKCGKELLYLVVWYDWFSSPCLHAIRSGGESLFTCFINMEELWHGYR